jgi:glycosyltransferase involved in cell wall biosynthesis
MFEVVVVNGPSTDGTAKMLEKFSDRARLIDCAEANLGLSRNLGVAAAAGSIVVFTDDDAIPNDDWLEILVAAFSDESVGAVGGTVFDVPLNRVEWKLCTCSRLGIGNTDSDGAIGDYLGVGADPFVYLAGCNMAFRRDALVEVDGFNSLMSWGYDDVDICCRIIDADYRIAFEDQAYVKHDRAPSAVRDGRQVLRDPYQLIYSRAVFALQCSPTSHTKPDIIASIEASMNDWKYIANQHMEKGEMSEEEHNHYLERAKAGICDGINAGLGERPLSLLPDALTNQFRSYCN